MASFKDRLEEAMAHRHMSAADLSRKTGIGEGAISQYRRGAYKASQRNLEKIANALSVPISWLMGADDSFSLNPTPARDGYYPLTDDELQLITDYRYLNDEGQSAVRDFMGYAKTRYPLTEDTSSHGQVG